MVSQPGTQQVTINMDNSYEDFLHSFSALSHNCCNDTRKETRSTFAADGLAIITISKPLNLSF